MWSISRLVGAGAREPAGSRLRYLVLGYVIWLVWLCGFAGLRVRGFAGSRLRYPAGVVVRVRGVRAALSGSRLHYLAGACAVGVVDKVLLTLHPPFILNLTFFGHPFFHFHFPVHFIVFIIFSIFSFFLSSLIKK